MQPVGTSNLQTINTSQPVTNLERLQNKYPRLAARIAYIYAEAVKEKCDLHLFESYDSGCLVISRTIWNKYGSSPGWSDLHKEYDPQHSTVDQVLESCLGYIEKNKLEAS